MDTLERLNAALTYIEANLDNEIDSKELSKITFYSAYRFQKLFMAMSGMIVLLYTQNPKHTPNGVVGYGVVAIFPDTATERLLSLSHQI